MMKNNITAILILTIFTIFFVSGCAKTEIKPATPAQPTPEGLDKSEIINDMSDNISDIDAMADDLDTGDLDNLSQDLDNLDW